MKINLRLRIISLYLKIYFWYLKRNPVNTLDVSKLMKRLEELKEDKENE